MNKVDCSELDSFLYKLKSEFNFESIYYSSYYEDCLKKVWKPNLKDGSLLEKEINNKHLSNLCFDLIFQLK